MSNNSFGYIASATSVDDQASLLAIQKAVKSTGPYSYLEIGSHLGGTLQTHIADPLCSRIWSIDKRVSSQPDERGHGTYGDYGDNSTRRMLEGLRRIPGADLNKLTVFDCDTQGVPANAINLPTYCFVDAEHTDRAIQSDFDFCDRVSGGRLIFVAHDSFILYRGINTIVGNLAASARQADFRFLPSSVFLIDTTGQVSGHSDVISRVTQSWRGYLDGLLLNDFYRREYLKMCADPQSSIPF